MILEDLGTRLPERFNRAFSGKFWKAQADLEIAQPVSLSPHKGSYSADVPVRVFKEQFPSVDEFPDLADFPIETFAYVDSSVRSICAQSGVDVATGYGSPATYIASALAEEGFTWKKLPERTDNFEVLIPMGNRSQVGITLARGMGVLRFMHVDRKRNSVRGRELINLLKNNVIEIEGEQGQAWDYMVDQFSGSFEDIGGLFLRIREDSKMWIPPDPNHPIVLSRRDGSQTFRKKFKKRFQPVPTDRANDILTIAETDRLKLPLGYTALINRHAVTEISSSSDRYSLATHIESLLLNGGYDWRIRLEIEGHEPPIPKPKADEDKKTIEAMLRPYKEPKFVELTILRDNVSRRMSL